MYPLFYWLLMMVITVRATPGALLRPQAKTAHWKTDRIAIPAMRVPSDAERTADVAGG